MSYFLKLIRIQNLIFIALTQFFFRYCILLPIIKLEQISPAFSSIDFSLLVLSTVFIAAAGYAINDYFDIRIDRINKPQKIIVGKYISRRQTILTHTVFNVTAVVIGIYLSYKVGSIKLAAFNLIMCALLWFYSVKYKAFFLIGNIIISLSSAMTIIVVWLFEIYALKSSGQIIIINLKLLNFFLFSYVIFAFFVSLIREIVKDVEDIEGDKKCGCSTLPIVMGDIKTKYVLLLLVILLIIALSFFSYLSYFNQLTIVFWYINIALIMPLLYTAYVIYVANNKADYTFLSGILKFIMFAGIFSMTLMFNWF